MPTNANKPVALPAPIAAYFTADAADAGGVARWFTENGVVIDERREHQGRDAVARWKTEATAKYHYTSEPLTVDVSGAYVTVITRVTGDFPGSPIELRYRFTLEGDKIASLEITP
jgi:SnoaL-like domain